jgi:HK97 family phage portal protein
VAEQNVFQKMISSALGINAVVEKSLSSGETPGGAKGYIDVVPQQSQTLGAPTPTNYATLYRVYKQHTWIRACVGVWARATTAAGWSITALDEKTKDDKTQKVLTDFFNYPNPDESMNDILEGIVTDLGIYGNAFIEVVPGMDGLPKEIWNLDATSMRVRYDDHGYIMGYVQRLGQNTVQFAPEEVIHFRLNSRGSTQYGMSPIETLLMAVDTDLKAQIYITKYYENFGAPKGLYKMKNATPEQVRRNRLYLATQVAGIENSHRNLMLEGDVEYQQISSEMKDTASLDVRRFLREEIFAVYGIPPSKVAVIESGNIGSGTGDAQDAAFKKETVYPMQNKIGGKLTLQLIRTLFGIDTYQFTFNREDSEDALSKAKVHQIYLQGGVVDSNEVRADMGKKPKNDIKTPAMLAAEFSSKLAAQNPDPAVAAGGAVNANSSTGNPKGQNNDPAPINQTPVTAKKPATKKPAAKAKK